MRRFLILLIFVVIVCLVQTFKVRKKATVIVPNDYATIEEAYANVKGGGIITIQPGKYELAETLMVDRNVTFRGSTGKAEDVVIDCPTSHAFGITGGSPSFQHLTVCSGAEKCYGFYVTGGTPKLFRCIVTFRKGTGMIVIGEKANPKVESCTIKDCGGSGVVVEENGLGTFNDCEIYGNAAVGIVVKTSGNPTVTRCKIHDGKNGGVLVLENGLGTFNDCEIYGNATLAIAVETSGNPTVTGCKIHDGNTGVYVNNNGLGTFNDCEIYGNEMPGIGVETSGNPTVTGCKIHDGKDRGVVVWENGLGTFNDCEIYGNVSTGIEVQASGNPTVTGCKIHDGKNGGVCVFNGGKGTFNNNTLENNFFDGELINWFIFPDAGEVKGTGNTPEIPKR